MPPPLLRYFTIRRIMIAYIVGGFLTVFVIFLYTFGGFGEWGLPPLDGLRIGMTKAQVHAVVGPPTSEGKRPDGTSWGNIKRSGSWSWIELDYDATGRLIEFHYECF